MNNSESAPANSIADRRFILWRQVLSLAAVQGGITLTWVIYKLYLPALLKQFGFPATLAASLLLLESALAVVMEPLMGGVSDRTRRWVGTRFPLISLGVILSSALFISIPFLAIFVKPEMVFKYLIPGFMVAWALAMTVFRSPVLCLLGQYASVPELPMAASFLMVAGGVIGAFAPISSSFLLSLGPTITFATGSIILLVAVKMLRSIHRPENSLANSSSHAEFSAANPAISISSLGLIFATGTFLTWGVTLLMTTLPKVLTALLPQADVKLFMFAISITIAVAALPAGWVAVRLGNRPGMLTGVVCAVFALLLLGFVPNRLILALGVMAVVASVSLLNVGFIPFVLGLMPSQRAGLAVGTYFGGVNAAASLLPVVFGSLDKITPADAVIRGVLVLAGVGVCVFLSSKIANPTLQH